MADTIWEFTPAGSAPIPGGATKSPGLNVMGSEKIADALCRAAAEAFKFNPRQPISNLAARLLSTSNGLHSHATDGPPASEPGTTRHAGWRK